MKKVTKLLLFLALSVVFAFGDQIDQGSTSDGVGLPCASTVSNCNQFFVTSFGGQLLTASPGHTSLADASVVQNIFIFSNSVGTSGVTLFGPTVPSFGVFNCRGTGSASAAVLGIPCVNLQPDSTTMLDSLISSNLNSSGNVVRTWDPSALLPYLPSTGPYAGDIAFYVSSSNGSLGKPDATYFGGAPYATPIPEPSSILLLASGTAGFLMRMRYK